jgi:hypothetical protein
MRQIFFQKTFTSADADILAGSELAVMPTAGACVIRAASTVNTATLAVSGSRLGVVSPARAIQIRANGEIRTYDIPWVAGVRKGEKLTISLAGTTGTVYVNVTFYGGS